MAVKVIIKDDDILSDAQKKLLDERFEKYEFVLVPSRMEVERQKRLILSLRGHTVVFASIFPVMIKIASIYKGYHDLDDEFKPIHPLVMIYDYNKKREYIDGKWIITEEDVGWTLV